MTDIKDARDDPALAYIDITANLGNVELERHSCLENVASVYLVTSKLIGTYLIL